jgi:hypothetical protein
VPPDAVRATRRFETIALGLLRKEGPLSKRQALNRRGR